ncbi:hypothetical protein M9Y10_045881 [Tritrichomonas musculus]|uniref:Uncharacterized protein n=1 Tax=Tritrichomonas musculus TaxID=1915356 RepID=A0ABR2JWH9_9EUKA
MISFFEKQLTEILNDSILFEKDESKGAETDEERIVLKKKRCKFSESFENAILSYPDTDYNWEEKVDSLGIKPILECIMAKNQKSEIIQDGKPMKIREKFWDDYVSQRKHFKTDKDFIKQWCTKRKEITADGEMNLKESTVSKLLTQFKSNEGVVYTLKKRMGTKP